MVFCVLSRGAKFEAEMYSMGCVPIIDQPSHTAEVIAKLLEKIISESLEVDFVPVITLDSAANMTKAIRQ